MRRIETLEEGQSRGRVKAVYQEIEHALGAPFVGAIFRALAVYPDALEQVWTKLKPNVETQAFIELSAQLRRRADLLAEATYELVDLYAWMRDHGFDREDIRRVRYTLELFHYLDPKLLLCTAAINAAINNLTNDHVTRRKPSPPTSQEPEFPTKIPHVMFEQAPDQVKETYLDIADVMGVPIVPDEFQTFGKWPNLLRRIWNEIKPSMRSTTVLEEAQSLSAQALESALQLPYSLGEGLQIPPHHDATNDEVRRIVETFFSLYPRMMLSISGIRRMVLEGERTARSIGRAAGERRE